MSENSQPLTQAIAKEGLSGGRTAKIERAVLDLLSRVDKLEELAAREAKRSKT